jgi:hypothetical protein
MPRHLLVSTQGREVLRRGSVPSNHSRTSSAPALALMGLRTNPPAALSSRVAQLRPWVDTPLVEEHMARVNPRLL